MSIGSGSAEFTPLQAMSKDGPPLMHYEYVPQIQQYVRKWEGSIPNADTSPAQRFGDIFVEIKNERNRKESRISLSTVITGTSTSGTFVSRVNKVNELALEKLMPYIATITKTTQVVPAGTSPDALSFTRLRSEVLYFDTVHAQKETWDVTGFITLTGSKSDPETDFPVVIVREVFATNPGNSSSAGIEDEVEQVDEFHWLRTRNTISSGATVVSYDNIRYTFPRLLTGWSFDSIFLEAQGRTYPIFEPLLREEETKITVAKVTTTFHSTVQVPPVLYSFKTEPLRYDGIIFNVDLPAVLRNTGSLFVTTHEEDSYYGPLIGESFTWGSTNITASQYLGSIGQLKVVGFTSVPWRYNLFKTVKTEITLE